MCALHLCNTLLGTEPAWWILLLEGDRLGRKLLLIQALHFTKSLYVLNKKSSFLTFSFLICKKLIKPAMGCYFGYLMSCFWYPQPMSRYLKILIFFACGNRGWIWIAFRTWIWINHWVKRHLGSLWFHWPEGYCSPEGKWRVSTQ